MGGWASTQVLLDTCAHFLPRDMRGFSNALGAGDGPRRTQRPGRRGARIAVTHRNHDGKSGADERI